MPLIKIPKKFNAPPDHLRCQHPSVGRGGMCKNPAEVTREIPSDYYTDTSSPLGLRHSNQPDVARPKARLCRLHDAKVEAHIKGIHLTTAHEGTCPICRNTDGEYIMDRWTRWRISTLFAQEALDVSSRVFDKHVKYFGLNTVRLNNDYRKEILSTMIEKGLEAGDHSVSNALKATQQLAKEMGDLPVEHHQHNHNVSAKILVGTVDLTKLSNEELAKLADSVGDELRREALEGDGKQKALPQSTVDNIIDVKPITVPAKGTR